MKIKRNKIQCLSCLTVIESKSVHDFVYCTCQKVAIDGGRDYLKRLGNRAEYKELSEYEKA